MRKLVGSQHPILKLARDFYQENVHLFQKGDSKPEIFEGNSPSSFNHSSLSNQLRAIIVLLVAKCIDVPLRAGQRDADAVKAIHTKQKAIADITEMMHTAYTLHQTIVDIPSPDQELKRVPAWLTEPVSVSRMHDGNNLAALMGDFLLAKTSGGLSSLKNAVVTELMTNTISDFAESQFLEVLCNGPPQIMEELWLSKNRLGMGSLMRNACHSCLLFSGHEEPIVNLGKHLGEQLGLLLQASKEIGFYAIQTDEIPIQFDLGTLPVIYAAELKHVSVERLTALAEHHDYEQIYKEIGQCKPSMDKSTAKVVDLQRSIEKMLTQLNSSSPEAVSILINLIRCVTGSVSGQGDESIRIISNGY
jgi:decaprenyl-diphosphate synthase subunit 2